MNFKKHSLWLILLVLLYSAWVAPSARAHALLVRSNPAANAVLAQPPVQVELFFSEEVEEKLSSIRVFDSNNVSVDVGDVRVDPTDPTDRFPAFSQRGSLYSHLESSFRSRWASNSWNLSFCRGKCHAIYKY